MKNIEKSINQVKTGTQGVGTAVKGTFAEIKESGKTFNDDMKKEGDAFGNIWKSAEKGVGKVAEKTNDQLAKGAKESAKTVKTTVDEVKKLIDEVAKNNAINADETKKNLEIAAVGELKRQHLSHESMQEADKDYTNRMKYNIDLYKKLDELETKSLKKKEKDIIELQKKQLVSDNLIYQEKLSHNAKVEALAEQEGKTVADSATSAFEMIATTSGETTSQMQQQFEDLGKSTLKSLLQPLVGYLEQNAAMAAIESAADLISFDYLGAAQEAGIAALYAAGAGAVEGAETKYLAKGAYVKATPGGTKAVVGEGQYDEIVMPLSPENKRAMSAVTNNNGSTNHTYNIVAPNLRNVDSKSLTKITTEANRRLGNKQSPA
jgi:hypothetical protein